MEIPQKIEKIQNLLGLTQTQLAGRLGVSFATLNAWKSGRSKPRIRMQEEINMLHAEITGQKKISEAELHLLREEVRERGDAHKNVLGTILGNPDIQDQFVLKLTYHSNKIEGSTLSEHDTAAVIFDDVALPNKSLIEQIEAKNHQTAVLAVFDYVKKREPITEAFILKLHGILMNGIMADAGQYRTHPVRIVGVPLATTNYVSIQKKMAEMVREVSETIDGMSRVASAHAKFEQIHPFSDGNGRVGRLLMHTMLLAENIPPAVIKQEHKQLYYTYLFKAQTTGDTSQLQKFIVEAVMRGYNILERKNWNE